MSTPESNRASGRPWPSWRPRFLHNLLHRVLPAVGCSEHNATPAPAPFCKFSFFPVTALVAPLSERSLAYQARPPLLGSSSTRSLSCSLSSVSSPTGMLRPWGLHLQNRPWMCPNPSTPRPVQLLHHTLILAPVHLRNHSLVLAHILFALNSCFPSSLPEKASGIQPKAQPSSKALAWGWPGWLEVDMLEGVGGCGRGRGSLSPPCTG